MRAPFTPITLLGKCRWQKFDPNFCSRRNPSGAAGTSATGEQNDSQSLSMMVSGVSEETKQEEADRFNETNSQTMKKMQDL